MQAINRWRNWKPTDEKFCESTRTEVSKVSKAGFATFDTAIPGQTQNFSPDPRPEMLAQVELMPDEVRLWDDAMHAWTKARCAFREKSWGSVSSLYVDHIEHAHQTGGMFAPDRETFQAILMALGFQIHDGMVYGLILREDAEAAHWQPEPPKVMPRRKRGAR